MSFLGGTEQLVSASSQNMAQLVIMFSVSFDLLPHFSSSDSETLHFSLENLVSSFDLCIHTRVHVQYMFIYLHLAKLCLVYSVLISHVCMYVLAGSTVFVPCFQK